MATVLSIQDVQRISLQILEQVHQFCIDHHIRYSLAYGTLIGAIRHKGFIPWDDDIDILMPRPDYERFCLSFKKSGLGICSEHDPSCLINFCRVYDTEKTKCQTVIPFMKNYTGGVWIDIFPMDSVSDSIEAFTIQYKTMNKLWIKQLRYRDAMSSFKDIMRVFSIKEILILSVYKFSLQAGRLLKRMNRELRKMAACHPYGTTSHVSQLCVLDDGVCSYFPSEWFDSYTETDFEGRPFRIIAAFDDYLRRIYGDYLQLPPENERMPKNSFTTFYWKGTDE